MIEIEVNGAARRVEGRTIAALLAELGHDRERPGVAVAENDEVVPRRRWDAHELRAGDRVEIVRAVQGG